MSAKLHRSPRTAGIGTLSLVSALVLGSGCAQSSRVMPVRFQDVSSKGYSQRVELDANRVQIVHISGQVPVNERGEVVGGQDLRLQTEQVFRNIQTQVERAGGSMLDVIRIDCYFADISKIAEFRVARDKFINLEHPPTSTAVQVSRFVHPDFLIEINAIAAIKLWSE